EDGVVERREKQRRVELNGHREAVAQTLDVGHRDPILVDGAPGRAHPLEEERSALETSGGVTLAVEVLGAPHLSHLHRGVDEPIPGGRAQRLALDEEGVRKGWEHRSIVEDDSERVRDEKPRQAESENE